MQFDETIALFQDVFYPPEGYRIQWAELTTWSLAKDWLRMVSAMISAANNGAARARLTRPNSHIKACRDPAPFHVFYDAKYQREQEHPAYFQTANGRYAAHLFESRCTPVTIGGGLFHPKLILLQFGRKDDSRDIRFRLFLSSRNLTWSSYVESGVLLESTGTPEDPAPDDPGPAMARFLETYYKRYCGADSLPEALDLNGLKAARFRVVSKDGSVVDERPRLYFARSGTDPTLLERMKASFKTRTDQPKKEAQYFLRITSMNPTEGLLEDGAYQCQYLCNFKDMYCREAEGSSRWNRTKDDHYYLSREEDPCGRKPVPLHAKHYMFWGRTRGGDKYESDSCSDLLIWTGSANCSDHALNNKNEEVMLQFCAKGEATGFPGTERVSSSIFRKHAKKPSDTLCFRCEETVTDPQLPETEDEEDPAIGLRVLILRARYGKETKTLTVEVKNNEEAAAVSLWPAACSEADWAQTLKAGETKVYTFPLSQAAFTRLLQLRCGGAVYSLLLPLTDPDGNPDHTWYGRPYQTITEALPPDPLRDLSDLIPEQPFFDPSDKVFEKLTKCRMELKDTEFQALVKAAARELDVEEKIMSGDPSEETEEDDSRMQIFMRTEEVKAFRALLEGMMP